VGRNGGGIPGGEVVEVSVVCWRLCDVLLLRSNRPLISVPFLWSRGLEGVQCQWDAVQVGQDESRFVWSFGYRRMPIPTGDVGLRWKASLDVYTVLVLQIQLL
jgi:hypothetical protein